MKIFKGRGGGSDNSERSLNSSVLCPTCREAFKTCFKKDEEGKVVLDYTHQPKLCSSCKEKMKAQFGSGRYPDRG